MRISLDSIVQSFKNGGSPESILRFFPYGAITFYPANREAVECYLVQVPRTVGNA